MNKKNNVRYVPVVLWT